MLGAESDAELYRFGVEPEPWTPDEDATATINYTSGTTARPKGVQLTHRNLWINAATFGWQMGVNDRDVYLHTLPQFHCNGWGMVYAVTGMGGQHIVLRKVDGAEILRRIDEHGVTLAVRRPGGGGDGARRRGDVGRADPWPRPCADGRRRRAAAHPDHRADGVRPRLGVRPDLRADRDGTVAHDEPGSRPSTTTSRPTSGRSRLGRAGAPALGIELDVDARGRGAGPRQRGPRRATGTSPKPRPRRCATAGSTRATVASIDDESYLTISDRKKDVIISGGENISSIEVEDCLFSHPAVAEVAVIGVPDEKWGETVKALVVLAPGATATEDELIAFCRERMAHYKCPRSVELRTELARTATGKLQKFKLRESVLGGPRPPGQLSRRARE